MNTKAKPGSVLKSLRLANGWTLSEVSRRTGLPVSTLSKVENDKMSLSYDKLARISREARERTWEEHTAARSALEFERAVENARSRAGSPARQHPMAAG